MRHLLPKHLINKLLGMADENESSIHHTTYSSEGPGAYDAWRQLDGDQAGFQQTTNIAQSTKRKKIIFCDPMLFYGVFPDSSFLATIYDSILEYYDVYLWEGADKRETDWKILDRDNFWTEGDHASPAMKEEVVAALAKQHLSSDDYLIFDPNYTFIRHNNAALFECFAEYYSEAYQGRIGKTLISGKNAYIRARLQSGALMHFLGVQIRGETFYLSSLHYLDQLNVGDVVKILQSDIQTICICELASSEKPLNFYYNAFQKSLVINYVGIKNLQDFSELWLVKNKKLVLDVGDDWEIFQTALCVGKSNAITGMRVKINDENEKKILQLTELRLLCVDSRVPLDWTPLKHIEYLVLLGELNIVPPENIQSLVIDERYQLRNTDFLKKLFNLEYFKCHLIEYSSQLDFSKNVKLKVLDLLMRCSGETTFNFPEHLSLLDIKTKYFEPHPWRRNNKWPKYIGWLRCDAYPSFLDESSSSKRSSSKRVDLNVQFIDNRALNFGKLGKEIEKINLWDGSDYSRNFTVSALPPFLKVLNANIGLSATQNLDFPNTLKQFHTYHYNLPNHQQIEKIENISFWVRSQEEALNSLQLSVNAKRINLIVENLSSINLQNRDQLTGLSIVNRRDRLLPVRLPVNVKNVDLTDCVVEIDESEHEKRYGIEHLSLSLTATINAGDMKKLKNFINHLDDSLLSLDLNIEMRLLGNFDRDLLFFLDLSRACHQLN